MKILLIMVLSLLMSGCANAQSTTFPKLELTGEPLPSIRYVTDMKVYCDTLLFVYECEDGYGQRFLRRAIIDSANNTINISPDMGKREDGYYSSYMPYPFIADNGAVQVIGQDDCEIFSVKNDTAFVRTRQYLMDGNSEVPFPLSQYVQDVYMISPHEFVFVGREPNGGSQYALKSDITSAQVDSIRVIQISPELNDWMPNAGELTYSRAHGRLAFAYRLHPIVEIFGLDGNIIKQVRICEDTFDSATLDEADFEDLNQLHIVDITSTPEYIYALHWNFKYADVENFAPTIFKIDWDGKIVDRLFNVPTPLYKIAVCDDNSIIGWNGKEFIHIPSF